MECMGFSHVFFDGTYLLVFERQVENTKGNLYPYKVRVFSSISSGQSRGVGEDAIRVVLINVDTDRPVKIKGEGKKTKAGSRIYRTKSALTNLKERCREYFKYVFANKCPNCEQGILVKRTGGSGDFYGCSNFPICNHTKQR